MAELIRHDTVCPGSSDPILFSKLQYKKGHYFLDMLYFRDFQLLEKNLKIKNFRENEFLGKKDATGW